MRLRIFLLTACAAVAGLFAPASVEAAPSDSVKKVSKKGKKKGKKTDKKEKKTKKEKKGKKGGVFAVLEEPVLADVDWKNPPAELRQKAQANLKRLGITPLVYDDAVKLAVYDGSLSVLQNLLLAGQKQETLDGAFALAMTQFSSPEVPNNKRAQSARMLLSAGACANELTPEYLRMCRDRELDALVRSAPQFRGDSSLGCAIMTGDVEGVRKKLAEKPDWRKEFEPSLTQDERINMNKMRGMGVETGIKTTLLSRVAMRDDHEMFKLLLDEFTSKLSDSKERTLYTILSIPSAFSAKSLQCMKVLLESELVKEALKVERMPVNGLPAALSGYNASMGDLHLSPALLQAVYEASAFTDEERLAVLNFSVLFGHADCIKALYKDAAARPAAVSPLVFAIADDDVAALEKLLKKGRVNDVIWKNAKGEHTALSFAAHCGSCACLETLLKQPDIDVNAAVQSGYRKAKVTPLSLAALGNRAECVRLLLNAPGLDVKDNTILNDILLCNNMELTKRILQNPELSPNAAVMGLSPYPVAPLCLCIQSQFLSGFLALVHAKDTDVNVQINTTTPLHVAAAVGHLTALQVLLSRNADATKKNHMGNTPAELAQQNEAYLYTHRFLTVLDAGKRPDATAYKKEVADRCLELFSKAGGAE